MTIELELLANGYPSIEGPTVDAAGNLYFTNPLGGGIYKRSPTGEIETVVPKRKGVGGLCLHRDGGLVVSGRDISHVRDGETRILFGKDDYAAAGLDPSTSFNDIGVDDQGRVLAGAVWGDAFGDQVKGALVLISAQGRGTMLYDGVVGCNGVALDRAKQRLYHCSTYARQIIVSEKVAGPAEYKIVERLSTQGVDGFPDGSALDEEGCLWVAFYEGGAVVRLSPEGKVLERIAMPAHGVMSVCFGGPDGTDLYITTGDNTAQPELGGCIYRARLKVRGAPVGMVTI